MGFGERTVVNRTPGDNGTQPQAGAGSVGRARRSPDWLTGVIMVAPVALLIAVFFVYSTYRAVYQSTRIESPIFKPRFVGLQNYRDLLDGRFFRQASENSLVFVFTVFWSYIGFSPYMLIWYASRPEETF